MISQAQVEVHSNRSNPAQVQSDDGKNNEASFVKSGPKNLNKYQMLVLYKLNPRLNLKTPNKPVTTPNPHVLTILALHHWIHHLGNGSLCSQNP